MDLTRLKYIKEKGKLRIKIISSGYTNWSLLFMLLLRTENIKMSNV